MSLYHEGFTQNREISWLKYNERVLEEALDNSVPLFERLKYVSIFESNLDEFFSVRVGSLIDANNNNDYEIDENSGLSAREQLSLVEQTVNRLLAEKNKICDLVENKLSKNEIVRVHWEELNSNEIFETNNYYLDRIKPYLSAKIFRELEDFNQIKEKEVYIIAELSNNLTLQYGIVEIPKNLSKIYILSNGIEQGESLRYVLVEDIIKNNISRLFYPYIVNEIHSFNISRNAEVKVSGSDDPLSDMKEIVRKRKVAGIDKMIIDGKPSMNMMTFLKNNMFDQDYQIYVSKYISLSYVSELEKNIPNRLKSRFLYPEIKPFNQLSLGNGTILERLKRQDILSHYPYDSMEPFLQLLRESSVDENVKEIRITIYRLSSNPEIIKHLIDAANNGKEVNVLIELRARFDEENNIDWAEKLKANGCNVYYGSEKYKVHSKICQIVLKNEINKYITQLSTGNYNEKTAKQYTDFSLITYDQRIGKSVDEFWQDLIGDDIGSYEYILTSPKTMKNNIIKYIEREASKGEKGRIFIKINSISDEDIIESLMEASCKGCKIRMIVRGISCLLPGVEYCTENIEIVNVVGRFLEHSRVYIFGEGSDEELYISSADLMPRNMNKRIELACPIFDKNLRNRIKSIMYLNFFDNVKGRSLNNSGNYLKKPVSSQIIDSQKLLQNN